MLARVIGLTWYNRERKRLSYSTARSLAGDWLELRGYVQGHKHWNAVWQRGGVKKVS